MQLLQVQGIYNCLVWLPNLFTYVPVFVVYVLCYWFCLFIYTIMECTIYSNGASRIILWNYIVLMLYSFMHHWCCHLVVIN